MTKRDFVYPGKKCFDNRYLVSTTGRVFNKVTGKELKYHPMPNGGVFVRICGGKCIVRSISVAKMVLLTYRTSLYKKNKIAIHSDGDVTNDRNDNLFWGTRAEQAEVAMKKKSNFDRVSTMCKNYHKSLNKAI
jgi:hypothetical protein